MSNWPARALASGSAVLFAGDIVIRPEPDNVHAIRVNSQSRMREPYT